MIKTVDWSSSEVPFNLVGF